MRVSIVRLDKTAWTELARYSIKAIKEGLPTHVYNDGILFTRTLIKESSNETKEMVVLVGSTNSADNAYRLCRAFVGIDATIRNLEEV